MARTPVDTINPFKDRFKGKDTANVSNLNKTRDTIIAAVELSARSKVPMLFVSNPGYGKTTTIYNIAKNSNKHVEVLCGSQYSQDEILGFQTNEPGSKTLIIKEPEWFSNIWAQKNKGISSILFLDELGTVSPNCQGALLQLVFERRIRGGKSLPDDCLVVAATNYKANLPGYVDIIAPQLNRFCIINLLPDSPKEIIYEFTQGVDSNCESWPEFENYSVDEKLTNRVSMDVRQVFEMLFSSYIPSSSRGFLDIQNITYDGIFDRDDANPEVLNFISGRTISHLIKCLLGLVSMGIDSKSVIFPKMIDGLIGLGTNSWSTQDDGDMAVVNQRLAKYLDDIHARFGDVLDKAIKTINKQKNKSAENETLSKLTKLMGKDTVSNHVSAFVAIDDYNKYMGEDWTATFKKICDSYDLNIMDVSLKEIFKDSNNVMLFKSDMDVIDTLIEDCESASNYISNIKPYVIELVRMRKGWQFYYEAASVMSM